MEMWCDDYDYEHPIVRCNFYDYDSIPQEQIEMAVSSSGQENGL